MFETEEKTNKALAGTQRRGRLAAICRSTSREAPQEGSQSHGRGEHPLGRAAREGLTWCEAGFGAKAAPAGPTLGPGCMNDPKHLIHPSRDRHQAPAPKPAHAFQVGARFLQHISLCLHCLAAHGCEKGTWCHQEDAVSAFSDCTPHQDFLPVC